MHVLWVEDKRDEINYAIDALTGTRLIEVDHFDNYAALGSSSAKIRRRVARYDLLILDTLIEKERETPDDFERFVESIVGQKPFLVCSRLGAQNEITALGGGYVDLGDYVARRGGLGVIQKLNAPPPKDETALWSVVEKVMWFYWTRVA
jgi:hypothetical protein